MTLYLQNSRIPPLIHHLQRWDSSHILYIICIICHQIQLCSLSGIFRFLHLSEDVLSSAPELVWYGCDISTCQCTFCYMDRMTNACTDDLCIDSSNFKHFNDLTDQRKSVCGDIIQSSKERRYICSTCSCSK